MTESSFMYHWFGQLRLSDLAQCQYMLQDSSHEGHSSIPPCQNLTKNRNNQQPQQLLTHKPTAQTIKSQLNTKNNRNKNDNNFPNSIVMTAVQRHLLITIYLIGSLLFKEMYVLHVYVRTYHLYCYCSIALIHKGCPKWRDNNWPSLPLVHIKPCPPLQTSAKLMWL